MSDPKPKAPTRPLSARAAAHRVLCRYHRGDGLVRDLIGDELAGHPLSGPDRALLTELSCGAVRHQITLDHVLGHFVKHPLHRTDPDVLDALRLGLYQVLFLERVPVFAAVNETVDLVRYGAGKRAAGFANGVLRAVLRAFHWSSASESTDPKRALPTKGRVAVFDRPLVPDPTPDPVGWMSVVHGHPRWLVERWLPRFGPDLTAQICQANNASPPVHIRWRGKGPAPSVLEPVEGRRGMYWARQAGTVSELPGFDEGHAIVQGVPGAGAVCALHVDEGTTVLDVCAAPGVKAAHLADLAGPSGRVIAVDKSLPRMKKLKENVTRLRIMSVVPLVGDATRLGDWLKRRFDRILVDVPCSNTGELSRRVEVRHRLRPDDVRNLVPLQSALLSSAAALLQCHGLLVYSTCSLEEEEGPGVVRAFLADHAEYELQEEGWSLPHENGSVGGYLARMARLRNSCGVEQ